MKWLVVGFASLSFACSSEKGQDADVKDTTPACVAFDAGPKGTPPTPADTSEPDDDAAADAATDSAAVDSGPIVTKAEIDDIFKLSCSFSSCHGAKPGKGNLYIPGPPGNWYTNVVDVPSQTHKTMKRIVPYDPQNSFLVLKLTDGLCAIPKTDCVDDNCGDRMPQTSEDPIDPGDRDKIINWIRQGAKEL